MFFGDEIKSGAGTDSSASPHGSDFDTSAPAVEMSSTNSHRKALLVFANALALEIARRKWPKSFRCLLRSQQFDSGISGVDVHIFTSKGFAPSKKSQPVAYHTQQGDSFGGRLENAVETLAGLGYSEVVIVGRDCPDLETADIHQAFQLLETNRLVLGPDHRGGSYLIAFHIEERFRLKKIRWHINTDCRELEKRFGSRATFLLPVRFDLDSLADIRLLARSESRWQRVAAFLIKSIEVRLAVVMPAFVDSRRRRQRIGWQLPPPLTSLLCSD